MAEQAGGGTGEQVFSFRRSGAREIRAFDRCGARVVRRPTGARRASGRGRGAIPPCQELAAGAGPASEGCGGRPGPKGRTVADPKGATRTEKGGPAPE